MKSNEGMAYIWSEGGRRNVFSTAMVLHKSVFPSFLKLLWIDLFKKMINVEIMIWKPEQHITTLENLFNLLEFFFLTLK